MPSGTQLDIVMITVLLMAFVLQMPTYLLYMAIVMTTVLYS